MISFRETVLEAIDGGARDRDAVIEATGLEQRQVSNVLFQLKAANVIVKRDEGYVRVDAEPPKRKVHEAVEHKTNGDTPPPKRAYTKRSVAASAAKANGAAHPVEFTYFGEFVVMRRTDVAELLATIERWRGVIEAT